MIRFVAALIFLCVTAVDALAAPAATPALIPAPASMTLGSGHYVVRAGTPLITGSDVDARWVAAYLADLARRTRHVTLRVAPSGAGVALRRISDASLGDEGYRLNVTSTGVVIEANGRTGLLYGAVTLWQLMTDDPSGPASIPALSIEDKPRFPWRGLMLDSARHYQSPSFIREFIDVMALHKLNVLHWHLTDDQAWRIEIKQYPRLTEFGAWRQPAGAGPAADIDPATHRPRLYGGFYSQDEVRALVAYAAARGITIVPEIEMPGHASAALASYPELAIDGRAPGRVPSDWGVYENLYNVNEDTFTFLENVLTEVMALFPSQYIHVGGDEAAKAQWERSPSVHTEMFSLGITDTHTLQSYVIDRISRFLQDHGRRLIGWDEILDGGLAPNATVMSWHGVDGAVTAAQTGHDAVLTPWPILYFDNRQSPSSKEPPGRGRIVTANDIYLFDPAPASLTPEQQHHILGVEGAIWTEHIRTEDRVWRMSFPRGAAIAELGWAPAGSRQPEDFARRLAVQERRYRDLGIAAWSPPQQPAFDLHRRVSQELEPCSNKIVLNLEDDAPVRGPRARFLIDIEQPCWIWRGVYMPDVRAITAAVGQVPFNFQIGDDINKIHFRPPATPEGELEVRLGCDGERIAVLPLRPAANNNAVTVLPSAPIAPISGVRNLCFTFTQARVDPLYAIDWIRLEGAH